MSAAPDTPRGRETERLMLLWRKQNPDADTSAYNHEWSATYAKLEFLDAEELTQAKLDWLWNYLREMGCRTFEEMTSEDHVKLAEAFFRGRIQFEAGRQELPGTVHFQGVVDALKLPPEARRWLIDTPPKRRREKRIYKANYPATKGAFGKPKHLRRR